SARRLLRCLEVHSAVRTRHLAAVGSGMRPKRCLSIVAAMLSASRPSLSLAAHDEPFDEPRPRRYRSSANKEMMLMNQAIEPLRQTLAEFYSGARSREMHGKELELLWERGREMAPDYEEDTPEKSWLAGMFRPLKDWGYSEPKRQLICPP